MASMVAEGALEGGLADRGGRAEVCGREGGRRAEVCGREEGGLADWGLGGKGLSWLDIILVLACDGTLASARSPWEVGSRSK